MATPRIFVSSTCYDLRYIRENLKFFIRTLGYEPVLSEEGAVFFDPKLNTEEACLREVPNCQLFVLIIGGRFGSRSVGGDHSVTNADYREAVRLRIPVFALVEAGVHNDCALYVRNTQNPALDASAIIYPSVDAPRIFDFVEEVRAHAVNNALVPFRDIADIESYLRQQWAAMLFAFLTRQNEDERVADTLAALEAMSQRIEMLSQQILTSVGTESAKLDAVLYEEMLSSPAIRSLATMGLKPTPVSIFLNSSLRACAKSLGKEITVDEKEDGWVVGGNGSMSRSAFEGESNDYKRLRQRLTERLAEHGMTPEEYVSGRPRGG